MKNYAAITIGPIIDTLSIAASPGTLWCASAMFSHLAGDLCESILNEIPGAKLLAPAYKKGFVNNDGIGRFHDRIFFACDRSREDLVETLDTLCSNAKRQLAENIFNALGRSGDRVKVGRYIDSYIQLSWLVANQEEAEKGGKNCILNLSQYLDSMELNTQQGADETDSPVFRMLSGTEESNNTYIYRKESGSTMSCWLIPDYPENGMFQLLKKGKVRDIKDIADPFDKKDGRKLHSYFAVVQSDGDNMGRFLEEKCQAGNVWEFSKACIDYTEKAARMVGDYGGLTIYAGGDDLLFLAPLEGKDNESLLHLCDRISKIFQASFKTLSDKLEPIRSAAKEEIETGVNTGSAEKSESSPIPTLSFGISVNYERFPLYEALEDARELLFGQAKTGIKNQTALSMHKHSGQSVFLLLPNGSEPGTVINGLVELIEVSCRTEMEKKVNADKSVKKVDEGLHSVLYHLENFRTLFIESRNQGFEVQNLYNNLFDAAAHDLGRDYINRVMGLGEVVSRSLQYREDDGNYDITGESLDVLTSMLRFVKLYTERGNES